MIERLGLAATLVLLVTGTAGGMPVAQKVHRTNTQGQVVRGSLFRKIPVAVFRLAKPIFTTPLVKARLAIEARLGRAAATRKGGFSDFNEAQQRLGLPYIKGESTGSGAWHADRPSFIASKGEYTLSVDTRYYGAYGELRGAEAVILRAAAKQMVPVKTDKGAWMVFSEFKRSPLFRGGDHIFTVFKTHEAAVRFVNTHRFVNGE